MGISKRFRPPLERDISSVRGSPLTYFTPIDGRIVVTQWLNPVTASSKRAVVRANAVYLTLTANFDLWPNPGLKQERSPANAS